MHESNSVDDDFHQYKYVMAKGHLGDDVETGGPLAVKPILCLTAEYMNA